MEKITLVFVVILSISISSALSQAQMSLKTVKRDASAVAQKRRVIGRVLTSASLPRIRIRFDKSFKYLGSQSFVLYDRGNVEQLFFVAADKLRHIDRMYMLQFEGYLSSINAKYEYAPMRTIVLGGQTYIITAEGIPNLSAKTAEDSRSDVARAASFLEGKGYPSSESIMFQRFVRVVDEAKRNEFILLYVEDAARCASPAEQTKAMQGLSGRALNGFTILK